MHSKLLPLLLLAALAFGCNFERNGDEAAVDEDLFSTPDRSNDPDVEWTDQSAQSSITANSADYDSSGINRPGFEVEAPDTLTYLRTPESFSTSKNIPNTTGIETNARKVKSDPLGKDEDYDGAYKDYEPKKHDNDDRRRRN